ncbi:MAG: hypothetical protein ABGX83_00355 [Nitrospira sp.]|nr:hypothetical protein [Candidatus Manganitrophaceae bacterium]HIL34011.1 hypothetical protein [Candidatus Manganitrophaceae bacterium]
MFILILKTKLRVLLRILAEEWATYFILGPVMVGSVVLLGKRIFKDFGAGIGAVQAVNLSEETVLRLSIMMLFLKVFFNFLPLARRFYPTERRLTIDDLLPIRFDTRYQVFYVEQLVRDFSFFVVVTFLLIFFGKDDLVPWALMIWLFFPGIEIGFTLTWIHLRSPNRLELLCFLLILSYFFWTFPIDVIGFWGDFITPILVLMGYWGFGKWRYRDVGRFEQSFSRGQEGKILSNLIPSFSRGLVRILPKAVGSQVWRDLVLSFRNFVPAFWRNFALAGGCCLATAVRGDLSPVAICAVAVFLMATTASPLFALQRPFRASDFVLPIPQERVWRAKVVYSILISLPIPWIIWGIEIWVGPTSAQESLGLLVTLLLLGIAVAALTGGTICEGDQKPALHIIIACFLTVLATLFIGAFHPALFVLVFPVLNYFRGAAAFRLENEEFG